jgi:hypothetical protein
LDTAASTIAETNLANGFYTITVEIRDAKKGRATGVLVLFDGRIMGGDSYFHYAGRRRELITRQHIEAIGKNLVFAGREVSCGFTDTYSDGLARVEGTALVGKTSVLFHAELSLRERL